MPFLILSFKIEDKTVIIFIHVFLLKWLPFSFSSRSLNEFFILILIHFIGFSTLIKCFVVNGRWGEGRVVGDECSEGQFNRVELSKLKPFELVSY